MKLIKTLSCAFVHILMVSANAVSALRESDEATKRKLVFRRRGNRMTRLLQGTDKACVEKENISISTSDGPLPYCTPFRSPEFCAVDRSFPMLISRRTLFIQKYFDSLNDEGWWFHHLEDKLNAHVFTTTSNLPTPKLYYCGELNEPAVASLQIGLGFVIRTAKLNSSKGIYVFPNGFGETELLRGILITVNDILADLEHLGATNEVLIEEFIPGHEGLHLPTEYKFHMFNGLIGSINIVSHYPSPCWAEVDEDRNRLDTFGCFVPTGLERQQGNCFAIDFEKGSHDTFPVKASFDLCSEIPNIADSTWQTMTDTARRAGMLIGAYVRVDMFVSSVDGKVYIQEYSTNHMGGIRHCSAKADGDCVDSCFQGTIWKETSENTTLGGSKTDTPDAFSKYLELGKNEPARCEFALKPSFQPLEVKPSFQPSTKPSSQPSFQPSTVPSLGQPSTMPSWEPGDMPSKHPDICNITDNTEQKAFEANLTLIPDSVFWIGFPTQSELELLRMTFIEVYNELAAPYCGLQLDSVDIDAEERTSPQPAQIPSSSTNPSTAPSATMAPSITPSPTLSAAPTTSETVGPSLEPPRFNIFLGIKVILGTCLSCPSWMFGPGNDASRIRRLEDISAATCICGAPTQAEFLQKFDDAIALLVVSQQIQSLALQQR